MKTSAPVSSQQTGTIGQAPLSVRGKTLRFAKLARTQQIQEFLTWLPAAIQSAPGVEWVSLPREVMQYLVCTVAESPDAASLALVGAALQGAVGNMRAGKMVAALHRLLQRLRDTCQMEQIADLQQEELWKKWMAHPAFKSKGTEGIRVYAAVSGGHLPAYLQRLTPDEQLRVEPYLLPLLPHGLVKRYAGPATGVAGQNKRKEQSDVLVPLYPVLRQLVRFRKQLAERTFNAIRVAIQQIEAELASPPLVVQHTDQIPLVNRDARTVADVIIEGRQVTMRFVVWDKRTWVLHHKDRFSFNTILAARRGEAAYSQEQNRCFVQFDGSAADLLWFGELVEQRVFQQFTKPNVTSDEYRERWQFARSRGFSNGCTCTRPGLLSPSDYWFSDGARPGDLLFEPESLYRAILFGSALATIALVNGSRVSELLQVSFDRRVTHTETIRVLGEDGSPLLRLDGRLVTKQVKMHLQHLLPKGAKTDEERQFFPLNRDAVRLLGEIKQMLERASGGSIPVVRPSRSSSKYEHLNPERYVFQWAATQDGATGIFSVNDVQILLRFMLHGLEVYTAKGEPIRVTAHLLRHVMATHARQYQHVPPEAIALFFLHHRLKMLHGPTSFVSVISDYYWQMTREQQLALIREYLDQQEEHDHALVPMPPTVRDLDQMNEDVRAVYERWHTLHPTAFGNCGCPGLCPRGYNRSLCLGCSFLVTDPAKLGAARAWRRAYAQRAEELEAQGNITDARQARILVQHLDDIINVMHLQMQAEVDGSYTPLFEFLPKPGEEQEDADEEAY